MEQAKTKNPITNSHAHVFTHEHVPRFLARSVIIWPLYYLIHVPIFVKLYLLYKALISKRYRTSSKNRRRKVFQIKNFIKQHLITRIIYYVFIVWLSVLALFILFNWWAYDLVFEKNDWSIAYILYESGEFLKERYIVFLRPDWFPQWLSLLFAFSILLFVKSSRKIILFILHQVRAFFHLLPGEKSKELMARYLSMARFAFYEKQSGIYSRLNRQYPVNSHFVLLPMDMAYMGAGKIKNDYYSQMESLAILNKKDEVHAFVFIDPRRIRDKGKVFLDYSFENGKVTLNKSFVQRYIEDEKFAGFKIYPALGYFPFDEDLLALWKYAADNQIPIMTHGVKGVIYYRGKLKKEWNYHPVFTELVDKDKRAPLIFNQFKNDTFQSNFTHPLNFLCLLEEPLLRKLIGQGKSVENKELFGYTNMETPLKYNLSKLKVCYAHYGGAEEWNKYLEKDRDDYAQQLMFKPKTGINFKTPESGKIEWGRLETVWKQTDWYSIISSMLIQYENFYADISYIVAETELYPLLRETISPAINFENKFAKNLTYESRNKLRKKVLYGSDFYVVRSRKSDKDIFIELKGYLTTEEFDLIARDNPAAYLKRN